MPVATPLWLNSGVVSAGRNVFIVEFFTSRGNMINPPPSVCRGDRIVSTRVNESKLAQLDLGFVRQALHRGRDVSELKILREEHAVLLQRTANRKARLERHECRSVP